MSEASSRAFSDVESAPDKPGIYAWYYVPELSERDILDLNARVRETTLDSERKAEIVAFLQDNLFRPLRESPYLATVTGPLKPRYEGELAHVPSISDALVSRLAENPGRLLDIDRVFRQSVPLFASPIYIGVASKSLRQRLTSHKNLILRYRNGSATEIDDSQDPRTEREQDRSFARDVVHERGLHTSSLRVYWLVVELGDQIALDAENLLNRINYPLCGRR